MRIMVFFDLPTTSKEERAQAAKFRANLLKDGYDMLQWSIYARLCHSLEVTRRHEKYLKQILPSRGSIRSMIITEKQYARMSILLGDKTTQEKFRKAQQLLLF